VANTSPRCRRSARRLLEQHGIYVDEWQLVRDVQPEAVPSQEPLAPIDRRIDNVSEVNPFAIQPNALAGDQGSVEQILHVIVEPIDLVAQDTGE
jgi:hypothetical protein